MSKQRHLLLIAGFLLMTAPPGIGQVNTAKPGEPVERHLSSDQNFREWSHDSKPTDETKLIKVCRAETVCKMRYREGQTPRTRVRNLVVPLRYEDESTPISDSFTKQVRQALEILRLPASGIESDGRGASHPLASNETAQGRRLNRRIEVEFWYEDPLQALPDEPQLCPDNVDERVTRVYDPPWGSIPPLELANGQPIIPPDYAANLRRALADITERTNARLRFIGYTKNERLDRRTASVYGDDIGLSAARARRAMDTLMQDPLLSGAHSEHEGRGYVQSDDVVNEGFIQGTESFVRVQVVYDERLPLDNYEGVDITRLSQEVRPKSPYELNVMRITVDGKPIDDPGRSSSDIQRCTDVALDNAKIRFRFDNLEARRRLGVAANPVAVAVGDSGGGPAAPVVHFRMYSNYASFIKHAEIRIFEQQESLQAVPLKIIAVDEAGLAEWHPTAEILA